MKYFIRKLMWFVLAIFIAIVINFVLPRLMPGDPATVLIHKLGNMDAAAEHAIRAAFGGDTDLNLIQQFGIYFRNLLRGDLGISVSHYPAGVSTVLERAVPWTLGLVGLATIISFIFGTLLGTEIAWKRDRSLSSVILGAFLFIRSFPFFWFGLVLVYFFSFKNPIFPLGGGASSSIMNRASWEFVRSVISHGFLPAMTIAITSLGYWILLMRNNMFNVLAEDYITVAEAKGLSRLRIKYNYAARNAILPSITGFAMQLGFVVGGSLMTEMVFSYPGVGFMFYQATQQRDYPLIQGIFLFISIAVLSANFLADLAIMALDPRVRGGASK
ncbi:MAG: ABC transporter permease [Firmicutes bacterium]|nr:ABC transporter permease [Bacillota bacterium]